jgi:hypothetical protein
VKASVAPALCQAWAMAQSMERLLATPTTNPIFPANNDIAILIEKPVSRQVKGNVVWPG